MSSEFERIEQLFLAATEQPAEQREAWLIEACGGDDGLLDEVKLLLTQYSRTEDPLETAWPHQANWEPGETTLSPPAIAGYRLVRRIGVGGQAVVYEAIQESTGQHVAVKVLRLGEFSSPSERERFDRSIQLLANLRHPHIVTVIDRGRTGDGLEYLVTELVDGWHLDKYVDDRLRMIDGQELDATELLSLFLKIADAVAAAHEAGVIHRDLKPSNILVDRYREPRIIDFGLAKGEPGSWSDTGPVTISGQFLGSLPWASPEQADGEAKRVAQTSDVYSLGVILYQLLTGGNFPYKVVGNMRDVLDNILHASPTPPSQVAGGQDFRQLERSSDRQLRRTLGPIHPTVEAIVLKALEKKPERRQQSAKELANEIRQYLSGKPTSEPPVASSGRRRSPLFVPLAVVSLAAVLLATFLMTRPASEPDSDPGASPTAATDSLNISERLKHLVDEEEYEQAANEYITWSQGHRRTLGPDQPDPEHEQVTIELTRLADQLYEAYFAVSTDRPWRDGVVSLYRAIIREDHIDRPGRTAEMWFYGEQCRSTLAWAFTGSEHVDDTVIDEVRNAMQYHEPLSKAGSAVQVLSFRGSTNRALGNLLARLRRLNDALYHFEQAVDFFTEVLAMHPGEPTPRQALGYAKHDAAWLTVCSGELSPRRARLALQYASDATELLPDVVNAEVTHAAALYRAGDLDQAAERLSELESNSEADQRAIWVFLSLIHAVAREDLGRAREFLEKAGPPADPSGDTTPNMNQTCQDLVWRESQQLLDSAESNVTVDSDIETRLKLLVENGQYAEAAQEYVVWSWDHRKNLAPDVHGPEHERVSIAFAKMIQPLGNEDYASTPHRHDGFKLMLRSFIREDDVERVGRTPTLWAWGGAMRDDLARALANYEQPNEAYLIEIQQSIDYQEAYHQKYPESATGNSYRASSRYALAIELEKLLRLEEAQSGYEQAVDLYTESLAARPNDPYFPVAISQTQWKGAWLSVCSGALTEQEAKQTLRYAQEAYQSQPDYIRIHVTYAAALCRAGKFEQAVEELDLLENHADSNKGAVWLFRALIHVEGGDLVKASELWERATQWVDRDGNTTPNLKQVWNEVITLLRAAENRAQ